MEDKGNADRVGKDKVYATELLVSSTLALDEMTSRVIGEIKPDIVVLSIADAFITHCGMNFASEGLYFGVPFVLFPQIPEQDAVAKRTEELGAGIRLKSISEEDILDALNQVLNDPTYKEGAAKVSESFRACGGYAEAKPFLESIAK